MKRIILDYTQEPLMHRGKYPSFDQLVFNGNGNVNVSYEPIQVFFSLVCFRVKNSRQSFFVLVFDSNS